MVSLSCDWPTDPIRRYQLKARYHELGCDPFVVSDEECIQLTKAGKQRVGVQRRRTADGCEELGGTLTCNRLVHKGPWSCRRPALVDRPSER